MIVSEGNTLKGYKETEVGIIPNDWDVASIGDVFLLVGGMSLSRAKTGEGDISYLHYGDIHKSSKSIFDTFSPLHSKIDSTKIKIKEDAVLKSGDIVFADASEDYADIGKNVLVKIEDDVQFIAGLHTIIARDTNKLMNDSYKAYAFKTPSVKKQLSVLANGSTVLGISKTNLAKVKFLIPPLKEQQKIAEILSAADEQIEKTEQLIEKTKELKEGLVQRLFIKGIKNSTFKKTEIGEIPYDWKTCFVEEIATVSTGNKDTQDKVNNGKYNFYVRSQKIEKIDSYSFEGEAILTAGDGVGVGKVFHYIPDGKFDFHQRVYKISNFKDILGKYFFYYFSRNFIKQARKFNAKTSVDSVRREMITKMVIPLPPIHEQKKIAEILSSVDEQIEVYEKEKEKQSELKKALMQQLLTGKIRVTV